jgi:putative solute:sodium symporter small subunit
MAKEDEVHINFFRPATAEMRKEVGIAWVIIALWAILSFGIPVLLWLAGLGDSTGLGASFLTRASFLGFPLHYWLVAQGCTIGFVLLCKLYCVLWDRKDLEEAGGA